MAATLNSTAIAYPRVFVSDAPRRMTAAIRKTLAILAAAMAVTLIAELAVTAQTSTDFSLNPAAEDRLAQLINGSRAVAGLPGLALRDQLVQNARNHSHEMARQGIIFHNPALAGQVTGSWQSLGENVGVGGGADELHTAFMNSQSHRANVLGDFDQFGIGIMMSGGTIFVTEVFWKSAGTTPSSVVAAAGGTVSVRKACRVVRGRKKCTTRRTRPKARRRSRR